MSASLFGSGFGGGGGGGSITTPVSIANGGTGQTTANAALNALAALTLGQSATFALADNITNTAPVGRVLKHTSSGTTAAGFGIGDAVDLQSAAGNLRRVMTDVTSFTSATDTAETTERVFSNMTSGALQATLALGNVVGIPAIRIGTGTAYLYSNSAALGIFSSTTCWLASNTGITHNVPTTFSARLLQGQGASVASATTVTLGSGGNVFPVSGTTTINGIVTTGWSAGAVVYLKFAGILTVTHNSGAPGGGAVAIKTTTAANITTAANSIMTLMFDGSFWVQTCPITPGY